ncbi:helix-turn-helix domain-containing protein [uncultured Paludibaculum sp.]|uniref:helix-turn-helix domain-containing protein n=1 Tax=uncultured Paludibaculum sp. TaxID=1765020 RepID=UPI002AABF7EA|nr:helix-turn-helix domain-containing protein [uncultured Paludibaculum sp.]
MPTLTTPASKGAADANQFRALRRLVQSSSAKLVGKGGESVAIPASVRTLLVEIARNMEAGKAVSVVAEQHELTTQRAANILGVSRPFLVRMLEEGKLAFHMVGSHRRVYLSDLLEYKTGRDRARHEAVRRLACEDVEAGTYDKVILPKGAQDE